MWGVGGLAWAAAGGGLIAVALDGRVARFPVLLAALLCLGGVATLAVENAGRRRGLSTAAAYEGQFITPLRKRAWQHIAAPIALLQFGVNAGASWVLFHDYTSSPRPGAEVLTDSVALADGMVVVVLLTIVFGALTGLWGAHDAATGRVSLDDPTAQSLASAPKLGVQALVYSAAAALLAFRLAGFVLPPTPSLWTVIVTRGLLAGLLVGLTSGVAYVRGACNQGVAQP